jgi:hypothetical protein
MQAEPVRGDTSLRLIAQVDRKNITGKVWLGGKKLHIKTGLDYFQALRYRRPIQMPSWMFGQILSSGELCVCIAALKLAI